ncbi:MAG: hypothetical protein LUI07_02330 [Lachnospiraceae bacterium]|nr:hypothetical protein [Lachnospiraceae bacterium]
MNFEQNRYISSSFRNNQPGANELAETVVRCMEKHPGLNTIVAVLESTSVYSIVLVKHFYNDNG